MRIIRGMIPVTMPYGNALAPRKQADGSAGERFASSQSLSSAVCGKRLFLLFYELVYLFRESRNLHIDSEEEHEQEKNGEQVEIRCNN
ncbi:MAG: hypothetical protein GX608_01200 [Lentisphaerae bacterium]|nr:hypothetical protein [Lentisphaerota bacterium]